MDAKGKMMKRVTGIGEIFFKAKDPEGNRIELWEPAGGRGKAPAEREGKEHVFAYGN